MDPLSGIGLAASIVQFISFATTLIHKSIEIHGSGATKETISLEDTYETLRKFSHGLGFSGNVRTVVPGLRDEALALESLSNSCQKDCDKLLKVVSKLKAEGRGKCRLLKTFKDAWAAFIKDDEIASLERRLSRSQATLTLCVCDISNYYLKVQIDELVDLKREAKKLHVHQDEKLIKIQATLDELKDIIQDKRPIHTTDISDSDTEALQRRVTNFSDSDIEVLRSQLSILDTLRNDVAREHRILESLRFERQPERYKSIPKAHRKTFSWILDPSNTDTEASKLRRWLLQADKNIFWVSGKPGSGKSTLMKFVADHEETKKALSTWAKGVKLITASHYFWWSGTALQKSQEGLLRTLLYSILQQCPDLTRKVCEEKWIMGSHIASFTWSEPSESDPWTLEELHSALNAIAEYPDLKVKFCFFIDGLDEYKGDHKEICDTFLGLVAANSAIKICLSSRPWNVFKQAFGNKPERIYIHDLTREDITAFTQSRLSQHPEWKSMSLENPGVHGLVDEITERAQGVFLWVFLVTVLLCEGLDNGDSLLDLRLRLETFPSDLERFFKDILDKVDSFYHTKVSAVLQIALAAEEPLNISLYAFLEDEFENLDYAINMQIAVLPEKAVRERHRVMEKRLNGWSKGLVEVRNQEVHFLHRTVADFLRTSEMVAFIAKNLPPWFCIGLSLLKAHLAWIKTSNIKDASPGLPSNIPTTLELRAKEALRWASEIESTIPLSFPVHHTASLLLDDMEQSLEKLHYSTHVGILEGRATEVARRFFRKSVLHVHLAGFLSRKLLVSPGYFQVLGEPALSVLIDRPGIEFFPIPWQSGWISTLRCLLVNGQDPNQGNGEPETSIQASTPWSKFLTNVIAWDELGKCATKGVHFDSTTHNELLSLFLQHGVNPNALIFRAGASFPIFSTAWVDMLLLSFEVSSSPRDEEAYFQELEAFLRNGAKIDAASKSTIILDVLNRGAPAWEAFFSQLPSRLKSGESNASLLKRVTEILLVMMQDARIKLDWALEQVDAALGPVISQQLRSDLEARYRSLPADCRGKKKRRKGKVSRGGSKRPRISK